jgi:hypothetical protein
VTGTKIIGQTPELSGEAAQPNPVEVTATLRRQTVSEREGAHIGLCRPAGTSQSSWAVRSRG